MHFAHLIVPLQKIDVMRKIILAVSLLMALCVNAQGARSHERSEFSFQSSKVTNADGDVEFVKFGVYAGGELQKEYVYELVPPIDANMAETIGHFYEPDLNFDGYPDVDIYLGYMGGYANNTYHEALLWDQSQHCFVQAEDYNGIGEPMAVPEQKYIYTVSSDGPDHRVSSFYRWKGHELELIRTNTWAIESDEYVNFDGLGLLPCYRFDAKLDGRIPVTIVFQKTDNDDIVAGYIYYPKAKHPAPIMIVGYVSRYEDKLYYYLNEYQSDGVMTGFISIETPLELNYLSTFAGRWINPKTQKEMQMKDISFSQEVPTWFTESLLKPEDPGKIGREYSFQKWDQAYQEMMGGHITFRGAGRNKVHFECCNARHNIAEDKSEDGRPAVLNGNVFEYYEVNECHYGFRATFFPRFVVLKTITDTESLHCFGMGAAFDGVYVKVKQ